MPTLDQARAWYAHDDPVHGFDHIERVYTLAGRLARAEGADLEIVLAAALLHDAQDPHGDAQPGHAARHSHHHASAGFARRVLLAEGWPEERIAAVEHCIRAHRFRDRSEPPQTLEAQVLFDADKLDAIGAIGAARAIAYAARAGQPAYSPPSESFARSGQKAPGELHSSYHEHVFKLRKIKERMYTPSGRALAEERHAFLELFYQRLKAEVEGNL